MNEDSVAIYIRLSNLDEETGRKKDESDSIVNQRSFIHKYLDCSEELSDLPRTEYVDDGFTGTNMDRPAFQNMIKQIRSGKHNICIVKDFSRFSRDYIEIGDYLECIFPFLRVRFISINDNYDSKDYYGTTGGLDIVLKNIVYDAYSKDLFMKVKTAQIQSAKKGRRIHGYPGYGYMPDPDNKAMDVIDPEAAHIVRRIFDAAIDGMSPARIADMLNKEHILSPGQYYRKKHPDKNKFLRCYEHNGWNYYSVRTVLDRYTYTGAAVNMKRVKASVGRNKTIRLPMDKWIIVPGMHEAIISVEEYELAQNTLRRKPTGDRHIHDYPLRSLVVCGICGRKLKKTVQTSKRKSFYICPYKRKYDNIECNNIRSSNEEELQKIVYEGIMEYINLTDENIRKAVKKRASLVRKQNDLRKDSSSIEKRKHEILRLYEKYVADQISREKFLAEKAIIENEISQIEEKALSLEEAINDCNDSINSEWAASCEAFRDSKELTSAMSHAFVDRIIVYPDKRIEIKWKFCQFYTKL